MQPLSTSPARAAWVGGFPADRHAERQRFPRKALITVIGAAHALGLWGLLQADVMHAAVRQVAPLLVAIIAAAPPPPAPAPALPPPPPRPARMAPMPVAVPAVVATPAPPAIAMPFDPVPDVETPPKSVTPPAPAAPSASAVAAVAVPAAQPRLLPASNIAYLVPPPIELPLASRRLGEQGLVLLRVLVGIDGLPRQVSVQRSSGHARLDEQAVAAMKRARFKPQTDQGMPIEWIVIAPLQYEIE